MDTQTIWVLVVVALVVLLVGVLLAVGGAVFLYRLLKGVFGEVWRLMGRVVVRPAKRRQPPVDEESRIDDGDYIDVEAEVVENHNDQK